MLAQGVPLLLAGDEVGNSQGGNNNAYCQDNEIGWVDWSGAGPRRRGHDRRWSRSSRELRRRFPQLRAARWVDGRRPDGSLRRAVADAAGDRDDRAGLEFSGGTLSLLRARADRARASRRSIIVLNAAPEAIEFTLPTLPEYSRWTVLLEHGAAAARPAQELAGRRQVCRRRRARCWRLRGRHDCRRRASAPELHAGRRDLPPVGAGGQARRAHARAAASDAAAAGRLVRDSRSPARGAGTLYKFRIDGEIEVPDPASHFQPQDVIGPSEVIDHGRFAWRTRDWRGRPWQEAVLLELHVGTFTPGGTFRVGDRAARPCRRDRHHRDRADAARRFRRAAQLGL